MVDLQAIVAVIAGAAGGTAVTAANVQAVREVAKEFSTAVRYRRARQDVRAAKRLLGLHQKESVVYRSDNVHSMYAGTLRIHPDNRRALLAATGDDYLAAETAGLLDVQDTVSADLGQHLVLVGSPTSEGISRLLFGYTTERDSGDGLVLQSAPVDLPYRFVLSHEQVPERAVARRYIEGSGQVDRPNWRIETDGQTHIPEVDNDGWLRTDYLLVTRLRNFLTAEGFAQGHSVTSIAGTHGVGTHALGLLLRDNAALRSIAETTRGHPSPSFQALLRVIEIDHDERKGSRARRIELIGEPVLLGDAPQRWETAHRAVRQRVTDWINRLPTNGDM